MNISGMIVAELKRRRAKAAEALAAADSALALFTDTKANGKGRKAGAGKGPKKERSPAQKAAIAKAQEARRIKKEAPAAAESKGAPLAVAAED